MNLKEYGILSFSSLYPRHLRYHGAWPHITSWKHIIHTFNLPRLEEKKAKFLAFPHCPVGPHLGILCGQKGLQLKETKEVKSWTLKYLKLCKVNFNYMRFCLLPNYRIAI